jgi:hypothetical protein
MNVVVAAIISDKQLAPWLWICAGSCSCAAHQVTAAAAALAAVFACM